MHHYTASQMTQMRAAIQHMSTAANGTMDERARVQAKNEERATRERVEREKEGRMGASSEFDREAMRVVGGKDFA